MVGKGILASFQYMVQRLSLDTGSESHFSFHADLATSDSAVACLETLQCDGLRETGERGRKLDEPSRPASKPSQAGRQS